MVRLRTALAILFGLLLIAMFFASVPPRHWHTGGILRAVGGGVFVTLVHLAWPGATTRILFFCLYLPMFLFPPARLFLKGDPALATTSLLGTTVLLATLYAYVL
ncbi:hypothetical protein KMY69_27875, partial [Klebsiella pneumoniae]|uniref:hypothetical protein n=1 Tax=Klebsiella pneumoniae TaxID=573 RepID=UPI00200469A0